MKRRLVDACPGVLASELESSGFSASHAPALLWELFRTGGCIDLDHPRIGPRLARWVRERYTLCETRVLSRRQSADGTVKLLVGLADGQAVESVLMRSPRPDRSAGCLSSQVGCAMRCDFCASTRAGRVRDLSAGEILEQFLHLTAAARQTGRRLHSIVFMGMGEPMLNLDAVLEAITRLTHPRLGAISRRSVTVSTVGIVPGIERLAESGLGVHLAISLHAPDDQTRAQIMPVNRRWNVEQVLAAGREYQQRTGRIVTLEYTLLSGVNDSDEQIDQLTNLLKGWRVHVNLIPYNPTGPGLSGASYAPPTPSRIAEILARLRSAKVASHVRQTRGDDVAAACGQLRLTTLQAFDPALPLARS